MEAKSNGGSQGGGRMGIGPGQEPAGRAAGTRGLSWLECREDRERTAQCQRAQLSGGSSSL
jgi:hypothetical protein